MVLDETQNRKRAKKMYAVWRIFLHAQKTYGQGHTIVGCAFAYRRVVVPCAIRLWACKAYCEASQAEEHPAEAVDFRKLTELAADCVESIRLPSQGKAIVLFDSYYLCPRVLRACNGRGLVVWELPRRIAPSDRTVAPMTRSGWGATEQIRLAV